MGLVNSCFPTSPGGTPITTTTTATLTTTTVITGDCCPELVQTPSSGLFGTGEMTFAYNDNTCRSTATVSCGQPNEAGLELTAAIVVNLINYVEVTIVPAQTITFPATCVNGVWQMGVPPLNVMTLECQLSDPP
uniref:C6 domain-containing protein n=1 Tax=Panagrolaimus superbus TaxID=310955 RepID=A0A914ZDT9_9BILA